MPRGASLGAAGGHLLGPAPAGELDQVLVELEPDAVVAIDARRGHVMVVTGMDTVDSSPEADAIVRQPR